MIFVLLQSLLVKAQVTSDSRYIELRWVLEPGITSNEVSHPNSKKVSGYCKKIEHTFNFCRIRKHTNLVIDKTSSSIHAISSPFYKSNSSEIPTCRYCKKRGHIIEVCCKLKWHEEKKKENEEKDYKTISPIEKGF